jgi:F0F1-type ATP synthase assembly protein I
MMQFVVKLVLSVLVIVAASQVGKRLPALGGLIATMPLTTLIVLLWLHADHPDDYPRMAQYTKGVLWGIVPSIAFFLVVLACLNRQWPLPQVLAAGFGAWLLGAFLHQWFLR